MATTTTTSSGGSKRRRTTPTTSLRIVGLPDSILVGVANYLAKPSRVLFALAVTKHPSSSEGSSDCSQPTETSNAIISGEQWDTLDFGDIEKSLAAKLTDDNIRDILACVDAVRRLKVLKLAGCINITGRGLGTLRSSAALEQVDLSLVGKHESPIIEPEPSLLESEVIPILDGVISRGSIKLLHLPKKFRNRNDSSSEVQHFLNRYDRYLETFNYKCSGCEQRLGRPWVEYSVASHWYGTQCFTCSQCISQMCYEIACSNGGTLNCCDICEKDYCRGCVLNSRCSRCRKQACDKCDVKKSCEGGGCGELLCENCTMESTCNYCDRTRCRNCVGSYRCNLDGCNNTVCVDCQQSKGEGGGCDTCKKEFCSTECQYLAYDKSETKCSTCLGAAAASFRRKLQESKRENEELCQGMEDLYKKYMDIEEEEK